MLLTLRHRAQAILREAGWAIQPPPVIWSPRMARCAGLFVVEKDSRGKWHPEIRLSIQGQSPIPTSLSVLNSPGHALLPERHDSARNQRKGPLDESLWKHCGKGEAAYLELTKSGGGLLTNTGRGYGSKTKRRTLTFSVMP